MRIDNSYYYATQTNYNSKSRTTSKAGQTAQTEKSAAYHTTETTYATYTKESITKNDTVSLRLVRQEYP